MDPTNPRWETRESLRAKSATLWKIIAGAAGASALTAMVVASCLDRDAGARRTVDEPAYVETTAGTPAPAAAAAAAPAPAAAPPSNADSTGGVKTETTGATVVVPSGATTTINITNVTPPAANDTSSGIQGTQTVHGVQGVQGVQGAQGVPGVQSGPSTSTSTSTSTTQSPATLAGGSNPDSPTLSAGAGPFATEAPYWTSSAWVSNPDAGAGQFSTERNTPAR